MRMFHQLRRLVLALSGADEEILAYVPSDRARFESLGWAILITSGMADDLHVVRPVKRAQH